MKIKLTYLLRDMHVSREADLPAHFDSGEGTQFILWLREIEQQGRPMRQLCCDMVREYKLDDRLRETLLALKENRLLLDDPIQEGLPKTPLLDGTVVELQGNIKLGWVVDFDLLPKKGKASARSDSGGNVWAIEELHKNTEMGSKHSREPSSLRGCRGFLVFRG